MKIIDNPLRIKVTGKCNRACVFCHHEGGTADIEEIHPDELLKYYIQELFTKLNMNSVALTGGEPLVHSDLASFAKFLYWEVNVKRIYMTTNGVCEKQLGFWEEMANCGLEKINISVPDIFAEYSKNVKLANQFFNNQIHNIKILNQLGINVDINVVVFNDVPYTEYVIQTLRGLQKEGVKFYIYLLPNLNKDYNVKSMQTIQGVCQKLGYRIEETAKDFGGISNSSVKMVNDFEEKLFIKTTQKNNEVFRLPDMCKDCQCEEECLEGFYGLRLEKREGVYYIRLCLLRSTPDTLIPFEDFLQSNQLMNLQKLWNGGNNCG